MRKVFLHLSCGAKEQKVARKKEKELPRRMEEEDEEALAKKKTRKGHHDAHEEKEVLVKKKTRNGHQDNQEDKELLVKKKSLVMTAAARKRWKLAKNMFLALRRNTEVGAKAGFNFQDSCRKVVKT